LFKAKGIFHEGRFLYYLKQLYDKNLETN